MAVCVKKTISSMSEAAALRPDRPEVTVSMLMDSAAVAVATETETETEVETETDIESAKQREEKRRMEKRRAALAVAASVRKSSRAGKDKSVDESAYSDETVTEVKRGDYTPPPASDASDTPRAHNPPPLLPASPITQAGSLQALHGSALQYSANESSVSLYEYGEGQEARMRTPCTCTPPQLLTRECINAGQ